MQASAPTLKGDQGRVYFYRNSSMFGAAMQPALTLDGKEVGKSQPGGYFYVDTVSGSHEASASTEATNKVSFVLAKGESNMSALRRKWACWSAASCRNWWEPMRRPRGCLS
jgi:hypothetical protein